MLKTCFIQSTEKSQYICMQNHFQSFIHQDFKAKRKEKTKSASFFFFFLIRITFYKLLSNYRQSDWFKLFSLLWSRYLNQNHSTILWDRGLVHQTWLKLMGSWWDKILIIVCPFDKLCLFWYLVCKYETRPKGNCQSVLLYSE